MARKRRGCPNCAVLASEVTRLQKEVYHNSELFEKTIRAMCRQKGIAVKDRGYLVGPMIEEETHEQRKSPWQH